MTFGSLFAGIGGLDLGLERAGMTCRWQVEINPFARAVLAKHWPDVARYEDVRTVGAQNLERVDLICGGFPCQDISNAGKRVGIGGERSGLWTEYARILRELRPRYVLVENVAALLARGFDVVLGDLAALGFDVEWQVLRASDVGAPHRRERLFIVAYANSDGRRRQDGASGHGPHWSEQREHVDGPGRSRGLADAAGEGRRSMVPAVTGDGGHAICAGATQSGRCGSSLADADRWRRGRIGLAEPAWLEGARWGEPDGSGAPRREHYAEAVADAEREGPQGLRPREPERRGKSAARGDDRRVFTHHPSPGGEWPSRPGEPQHDWEPPRTLTAESALGRVPDGLPAGLVRHRRQQLEGYGNAVVPQIAEWIGRRVMERLR